LETSYFDSELAIALFCSLRQIPGNYLKLLIPNYFEFVIYSRIDFSMLQFQKTAAGQRNKQRK
jgi:hypothetical protein